jgi:mRNA interferase RelE/StbE
MVASRYELLIAPAAKKALAKIEPKMQTRIEGALLLLSENPFPPAARKLADSPFYRVRVSDYRIIYEVFDSQLIIEVINVGHRREIYRRN